MPSSNSDSAFSDTTAVSLKQLTEEIGENEDAELSTAKVRNINLPKTAKPKTKKWLSCYLLANLGWFGGLFYIMALMWHIESTSHIPNKYLQACNGTDVMSLEKYKQLKEDVGNIQEAIKGVNITITRNLFNENTEALQEKLKIYTDKLNSINSTLNAEKEKQFSCYKKASEKYLRENPDSYFKFAATLLCILSYMVAFYYMQDFVKYKRRVKLHPILGCQFLITLFTIFMVLVLVPCLDKREDRILREFPLDNL